MESLLCMNPAMVVPIWCPKVMLVHWHCCQRLTVSEALFIVRASWYQGQIKISGPLIYSWRPGSRRHLSITKSKHHKTSLPESNWWLSLRRTQRPHNKLAFPRLCRMIVGKSVSASTPGKWPNFCHQTMDTPAAISCGRDFVPYSRRLGKSKAVSLTHMEGSSAALKEWARVLHGSS